MKLPMTAVIPQSLTSRGTYVGLHGASLGKCPKDQFPRRLTRSPVQVRQIVMEISVSIVILYKINHGFMHGQ